MDKETVKQLQHGYYSDQYFNNTIEILTQLEREDYRFPTTAASDLKNITSIHPVDVGNIVVEMQVFTRRCPFAVISGMNEVIELLKNGTGFHADNGYFVNTYNALEIAAVSDGTIVNYNGDVEKVHPILRIRGRYRDFAHLETVILGVLTFGTRVATNTYEVLEAAAGKRILFFPARFDHYKLQQSAGYAYAVANRTFAAEREQKGLSTPSASVSTGAQAEWWNGTAGGTTSHSTIASFLGNAAEMMVQFARIMPPQVPRVALVDFHNDCVGDTLAVLETMFAQYAVHVKKGDLTTAQRYQLNGVRPDTSGNMIDKSIEPLGETSPYGVTAQLVWNIRNAIDAAADSLTEKYGVAATGYCQRVGITVTGGFNVDRIRDFEAAGVPVTAYGVGSSLLANDSRTNTDFTADIVKVKISEDWYPLAKVGRSAGSNPNLREVK